MRDRINAAVKAAMLGRDKPRLSALRLINAAIKNADIEARGQGKGPPGDDAIRELLAKMIKQRQESVRLYEQGKRPELAAAEEAEIAVIRSFLPEQVGEEETRTAIAEAIKESGATSAKDMGKVMAVLKSRYAGRMDFGKASAAVKGMLS